MKYDQCLIYRDQGSISGQIAFRHRLYAFCHSRTDFYRERLHNGQRIPLDQLGMTTPSTQQAPYLLVKFSPYLALVLIFSWAWKGEMGWMAVLSLTATILALMIPIVLCKYQSLTSPKKSAVRWWITGFLGVPFLHLLLHENVQGYAALFTDSLIFFLWLALLEAIMLATNYVKPLSISGFKRAMTMDNILLWLVILLSGFWASVFNSVDNPMENQPIHVLIDLKRNFQRFDEFIGYFLQFFFIYFSGYILYWVNHHVLVNRVMARFGVFHYLWLACIFTLIASPLLSQLALLLPVNGYEFTLLPSGNQDPFDAWNLRLAFFIMAISLPLILAFKWQQQIAEVAVLKQKNTEAELKWLQQQINPHFLFNTLNNLYSLSLSQSEKTPQTILQLSSLLRFVVYQGGQKTVTLQQEIAYLRDYLALQEIRVSHKSNIDIRIEGAVLADKSLVIVPLLLVVLLENAFKHGIDATDKQSWLKLDITLSGNQLKVLCINSTDPCASSIQDEQGGVGLENLKRRLELAYSRKYSLKTESTEEQFIAELTMELNSD